MRIDEDSTDLQMWMGDLLSMSDQADGLRQLVAGAVGGDGAGRAAAEPARGRRGAGARPGRWS